MTAILLGPIPDDPMLKRWFPKGILTRHVRDATETLSGKNVEDAVSEYGAVYGEVLLGMHRDLQKLRTDLQEQRVNGYARDAELQLLREHLNPSGAKDEHPASVHRNIPENGRSSDPVGRAIATIAIILSLAALGYAVLT